MRSLRIVLIALLLHCSVLGTPSDDLNKKSSKEATGCLSFSTQTKQPVIIDTDIGSFDDDPVAIALALSRPELDVKLVITCSDDTTVRARIAAKYLTLLGRDDIPVGIGDKSPSTGNHAFWPWADGFDISSYKGKVYTDGIAQMADIILNSSTPVDIIAIGPMTNFPRLLKMYPDVVKNARIRAMAGSVYKGYDNSSTPVPEYNIVKCISCGQETLSAAWSEFTMTPVDTSGLFQPNSTQVNLLFSTLNPLGLGAVNAMAYFCSSPGHGCDWAQNKYSFIFDPVATLLTLPVFADEWLVTKELSIIVQSDGSTVVKEGGSPICVAVDWKPHGLVSFAQFLTDNLCN